MKILGIFIASVSLLLAPVQAVAQEKPILVVDKCPEFCPSGIKGPTLPVLVIDRCPEFCPKPSISTKPLKPPKPPRASTPPTPPIKMCTQALIPVPRKQHWYWTDGCKTKMVYMPPTKNKK
jgi:hypothetical protein